MTFFGCDFVIGMLVIEMFAIEMLVMNDDYLFIFLMYGVRSDQLILLSFDMGSKRNRIIINKF